MVYAFQRNFKFSTKCVFAKKTLISSLNNRKKGDRRSSNNKNHYENLFKTRKKHKNIENCLRPSSKFSS